MATYYVDPSTGTGAGTVDDPTDPYEFESDVPATSTGDFVLFKRGTIHSTTGSMNPFGGSNVTYSTYYNLDGSDDTTQSKPIITETTGNHSLNIPVASVRIGFRFENLIFRDATTTDTRNVNIAETVYTTNSQIVFENCEMYNGNLQNVRVFGRGVSFINCIMQSAGQDNCYSEGEDMVFRGCHMSKNGLDINGDCIQIAQSVANSNNCIVEDNYLSAIESVKHCVIVGGNNHIIRNNECHGGNGNITLAGSSGNCVVRSNKLYSISTINRSINNEGDNNIIEGNYLDHSSSTNTTDAAIFNTGSSNPIITNNTVIGNNLAPNMVFEASVTGTPVAKNNILISGTHGIRSINTLDESHNSYWQISGNNYSHYPGDLAQTPNNAVTTDPQVDSNGVTDPYGPCYAAGTPLSFSARDANGRKFGTPPDIGAYSRASMPAKDREVAI